MFYYKITFLWSFIITVSALLIIFKIMDFGGKILCVRRLCYLWFSFEHNKGRVTNYLLQKEALSLVWLKATILNEPVPLKRCSSTCQAQAWLQGVYVRWRQLGPQ